jgi:hypothetical protein
MKRTILLLATVALVLLLAGGVAVSQNSSGGDVSIQSTTQQAAFTSGSGATFFHVAVSDNGNLLAFESPQGRQMSNNEGYAVCSTNGTHGYDFPFDAQNFSSPTITQTTAGAFPVTITRTTSDGMFQLKQVWNKPDNTEKGVTVAMTLKNRSSSTINGVMLSRGGYFNPAGVGSGYSASSGARTSDSVYQWEDVDGGTPPPQAGIMLSALTFQTSHITATELYPNWYQYSHFGCVPDEVDTPILSGALTSRVVYNLGNMAAGTSKTVKVEYSRM